jgi:hypothetical protein
MEDVVKANQEIQSQQRSESQCDARERMEDLTYFPFIGSDNVEGRRNKMND